MGTDIDRIAQSQTETQDTMIAFALLLSMLATLVQAAPLPSAAGHHLARTTMNITTTPNVTTEVASWLPSTLGEVTSTILHTLHTVRRCGGRRGKCGGGTGSNTYNSPPPPPPPTRITQHVLVKNVNASHYTGTYKRVMEAGWGIAIGIYSYSSGWFSGVSTTSSASNTCDAQWCGVEVVFRATVPSGFSHRADSLSPAAFCEGVASARAIMSSMITVPNATDVTVLTTHVETHEDGPDWATIGFGIGFLTVIIGCGCAIAGAAMAGRR